MKRFESIWQDVRYALRMMRRSPAFTAVAVLSLALGTGANTAVFSLIDTVMLRLLPVREPEQLVELLQHYPGEPRGNYWSWRSYEYYRDGNHVFSDLIAASSPSRLSVRGEGLGAETVNAAFVTGNLFSVLGVKPAIGRAIGTGDSQAAAAAPAVAMVSWSYWKNRLNSNPSIVGESITVQDRPVTVVGVAPPEFFGLQAGSRTDIWLPLAPHASAGLGLIGRLKSGVSLEQARAEMSVLYQFTIQERASTSKDPLIKQLKIELEPAAAGSRLLRDHFEKPLLLLMAVVALVLLIACTNIASLLLARGAARQKEMAVRVSLGAGRLRLVSQVLTESLLLSGAGSLIGIFLAYFAAGALVRVITSGRPIIGLPQPLDIPLQPDARVLLFTAGTALVAGLLFGLAPAWSALASAPACSMTQIGRSGETRSRQFFGKTLVIAQVALSVVLLSAAGLFLRHLANLQHIDLGFRRDHVLLVTLDPPRNGYGGERIARGYAALLDRMQRIPGVRSASLSAPSPLSGAGAAGFATVEGFQEKPQDRRYISISWVAPKYFETLGTPLLAGRDFNFQDQGRVRVAIINQAVARYYFPSANPVGKHVVLDHVTGDRAEKSYEIVGMVGDAKYYEIREAAPRTIYLPAFEDGRSNAQNFMLRTDVDPLSVAADVRGAVRDVLKTIPVARITTLSDQIDATIVPERLMATLSGLFGALGSTLAAIGLYGLLAYTVARRITEFGIRMALGATRGNLIRMVIRDAMTMVAAGLAIGGFAAIWSKDLAASLIQDIRIKSIGPIAFGAASMIGLALIAALLPARRAASVDPMEALRHE